MKIFLEIDKKLKVVRAKGQREVLLAFKRSVDVRIETIHHRIMIGFPEKCISPIFTMYAVYWKGYYGGWQSLSEFESFKDSCYRAFVILQSNFKTFREKLSLVFSD